MQDFRIPYRWSDRRSALLKKLRFGVTEIISGGSVTLIQSPL
jgi:hypothetical protein